MRTCIAVLILLMLTGTLGGQTISKEYKIKKGQTFLNLPVKNSARLVKARVKVDGMTLDQFTIKLVSANPEFWTFFDVTAYQGKSVFIEIENFTSPSFGGVQASNVSNPPPSLTQKELDLVHVDSKFPGQDSLYTERDRPIAHFTTRRGWINDPNGLVYYNGQYTVKRKAKLAKDIANGVMMWEKWQDATDGSSLLKAACDTVGRSY